MACRIFLRLLAVFGFCLISALAIGDDEPDPQTTEFPRQLDDVVPWLDAQVESVRDLDDYSCIMHVRERLGDHAVSPRSKRQGEPEPSKAAGKLRAGLSEAGPLALLPPARHAGGMAKRSPSRARPRAG